MSNNSIVNTEVTEAASSGPSTRNIHAGSHASKWTFSPIIPPLYMSTSFENLDPGQAEYEYSRCKNPTRNELETHLANLESAKFGLAFASGLAALETATFLLKSGDHVLCCDDVYGGVNRFFSRVANRMGIETTFVDGISIDNWIKDFKPNKTRMVWIESPTNPTMKVVDIVGITKTIKQLDPTCLVIVDNTFMTPVLQSPLALGADIVMHSVTKYINGHSDVIMGSLMTNSQDLYNELKFLQNAKGNVPSAFDCYQVIRSIMTLQIRVERESSNAMKVAQFLEKHPNVDKVLYAGLESHPQHELAKKQSRGKGFGGIISLYVGQKSGFEAIKLVQSVKVFHTAVSLGCFCSLIQIPSLMTHASVPENERDKLGMFNNLLRLSIGLENVEDIINDLDQALKIAFNNNTE